MPSHPKQPIDLNALVDSIVESLIRVTKQIPEPPRPLGAVKLSPEEQLQRYLEIRDDPARWHEIVQEHGVKDAITYARTMEQRLKRKGGDYGPTETDLE
jgi:hypothetical protein